MASKGTNSTILTVGVVALVGFAAWKLLPKLAAKLGGSSSSGTVGGGTGSTEMDENQNPYQYQDPSNSSLLNLISSLASKISGGSSGGGSSKSGSAGQQNGAGGQGSSSTGGQTGESVDEYNALIEGLNPDGSLQGASLLKANTDDSQDESTLASYQIPQESTSLFDIPGQDYSAPIATGDIASNGDAYDNGGDAGVEFAAMDPGDFNLGTFGSDGGSDFDTGGDDDFEG